MIDRMVYDQYGFLFKEYEPSPAMDLLNQLATVAASEPLLSSKLRGNTAVSLAAMGHKIPDDWLPGRFIMRLKPEERERLSQLKSDDAHHISRTILVYMSHTGRVNVPHRPSTFKMPF